MVRKSVATGCLLCVWMGTPIIWRCTCVRKKGWTTTKETARRIFPSPSAPVSQLPLTFRRPTVFPHCVLGEKLIKGTLFSAVAIFILCVAARQFPSFLLFCRLLFLFVSCLFFFFCNHSARRVSILWHEIIC